MLLGVVLGEELGGLFVLLVGFGVGAVAGADVTSKSGRSNPNGGKVLSTGLRVGIGVVSW
jgi:glycerol uptake facilitator-like aquaporin